VRILAAAPIEYAVRSEETQYSIQGISVRAHIARKISRRPWLLTECICNREISYHMQSSRQPIPGRDLDQPHD
jgi:hypothetical protein